MKEIAQQILNKLDSIKEDMDEIKTDLKEIKYDLGEIRNETKKIDWNYNLLFQ